MSLRTAVILKISHMGWPLSATAMAGVTPTPEVTINEYDKQEVTSFSVHWFRSTIFQILVVGGVFFCAPGMYNALSSLGAGGLATPFYANATAAAGYVFMAFFCFVGGIIVSKIGVKAALLVKTHFFAVFKPWLTANNPDLQHRRYNLRRKPISELKEWHTMVLDVGQV
ncbi:hypothetical protein D9757_003384 [Collybiopsis confluens]|uniref:Uncharacterized protein n=1 Tax=Collybiopsis confluens TaxID=2823264 RepID=A0A8H5HTJ1_9AGAR|nr:hypothetical protein D9757_003384 [Collybiopsis confluens]